MFCSTVISKPQSNFWEELTQCSGPLQWYRFQGVQPSCKMFIDLRLCVLAKGLSQLKVFCRSKWVPCISLFWLLSLLIVLSSYFAIHCPPKMMLSNNCTTGGGIDGLGVHVGSLFRRFICCVSRLSSCSGSPSTLCMCRLLVTQLIDGCSGTHTTIQQCRLGQIQTYRWRNPIT